MLEMIISAFILTFIIYLIGYPVYYYKERKKLKKQALGWDWLDRVEGREPGTSVKRKREELRWVLYILIIGIVVLIVLL